MGNFKIVFLYFAKKGKKKGKIISTVSHQDASFTHLKIAKIKREKRETKGEKRGKQTRSKHP